MNSIAQGTVKICGNREPELCRTAATAGADLLGFIFVSGTKRCIEPIAAAECVNAVSALGDRSPRAVGVFVDETPRRINEIARLAKLDLIQLHGNEPPEMLDQIDLPVIKVFRPAKGESLADLERSFDAYLRSANAPVAFLIDGLLAGHHGGTGVQADWRVAAALAVTYPVLLAGGLNPENVADAISTVRPLGVDVSSGVEIEGVKNPERIKSFVKTTKRAFGAVVNESIPVEVQTIRN